MIRSLVIIRLIVTIVVVGATVPPELELELTVELEAKKVNVLF